MGVRMRKKDFWDSHKTVFWSICLTWFSSQRFEVQKQNGAGVPSANSETFVPQETRTANEPVLEHSNGLGFEFYKWILEHIFSHDELAQWRGVNLMHIVMLDQGLPYNPDSFLDKSFYFRK